MAQNSAFEHGPMGPWIAENVGIRSVILLQYSDLKTYLYLFLTLM